MPDQSRIYRGQDAIVSFAASDVIVGILQDWTLSPDFTREDLRGAGSTERQDDQTTEFEVSIEAEFAEWNEDGYKALINYDEAQEKIAETSDVPHFDIELDMPSKDGANSVTPTVLDVRFDSPELSGGPDSWVTLNISGTGRNVTGFSIA